LIFNSTKPYYQQLHEGMIKYLTFLRDKSIKGDMDAGLLNALYKFPEVKQTWLGSPPKATKAAAWEEICPRVER
jgi:hypothetical protein